MLRKKENIVNALLIQEKDDNVTTRHAHQVDKLYKQKHKNPPQN